MKLCVSTLSCPRWALTDVLAACHRYGIEGVDFRGIGDEIDVTRLPMFQGEALRGTVETMRHMGLSMPCLNTSITLVTPAPDRWQMMLEECQRYAAVAVVSGTRYLRVFGGAVPKELSREEARVLAQRHLRQLVKMTRGLGVAPLLETHDSWATGEEVLELLHEFSPDDVGVIWDIEHPYRRGERPEDTAARLAKFIRHTHFKDSVRAGEKSEGRLLGEGELPIDRCIAALKSIGYDGWVCLETEKRWQPGAPEPEESIPQFAAFMAARWR